jgi:hypothetical protein
MIVRPHPGPPPTPAMNDGEMEFGGSGSTARPLRNRRTAGPSIRLMIGAPMHLAFWAPLILD